jgi:hypothetical protein
LLGDIKMGCCNGSCGFGGLPILSDEKIKLVIILNKEYFPEASGFSNMVGYASPISFVIDGKYNAYGGIILDNEEQLSVIMFRSYILYLYSEKKLKVSGVEDVHFFSNITTESFINDYIERNKVFIKKNSKLINVGIMMFSNDIFESMVPSIYNSNDYFKKEITEDYINKELNKYVVDYISKEDNKSFYLWDNKDFKYHKIIDYFRSYEFVNTDAFRYFRQILHLYPKIDFDRKKDVINMLKDMFLLIFMLQDLRRCWIAGSGKGGQDFESLIFNGFIKGLNKKITKYYEEQIFINNEYYNKKNKEQVVVVKRFKDGFVFFKELKDGNVVSGIKKIFVEDFLERYQYLNILIK